MLRCRTLGALELCSSTAEEHVAVLSQPKRAALLIYLAIAKPRGFHRRDTLLALFWPELDAEHARAALRQALTFLRRELGEDVIRARNSAELAINPDRLWCDAGAFEDAADVNDAERALALYRGDLLPGFHVTGCGELERWLEGRRHDLRDRAAELAAQLAERAESTASVAAGVRWAFRHLALRPDDERALVRLLKLLDQAGDRAAALREYDAFATRLAAEYGAEPSPETQAIVADLRARAAPVSHAAPALPTITPAAQVEAPRRPRWRRAWFVLAPLGLLSAWVLMRPAPTPAPAELPLERTAIAVLPFENLSKDTAYDYLADGLQAEILTGLSRVGAIKVISRTSVMRYSGPNTPPIRVIAAELGAGSIVEGSVQVMDARLRVNVRLIDAATDRQVWAAKYDRKVDDAFAVQSDVASRIVKSVGTVLTDAEQEGLARAPTRSTDAYLLYLQGRDYFARPSALPGDYAIAARLLERAVALDSHFALAHATLSLVDEAMYNARYDPSPQRAAREQAEARLALRLAPDLPQAHLAMGFVHQEARDYEAALTDFRKALAGLPSDADIWATIGALLARMGRWGEAIAAFTRAEQLNPRDPHLYYYSGTLTYLRLHRYAEAVRSLDRALTLAPDLHSAAFRRAHAFVLWRGELDTMRVVIDRVPKDAELFAYGRAEVWHLQLLLWERQGDSVLRVLDGAHVRFFDAYYWFYPASLYSGWAHQLLGDRAAAHVAFDSTRLVLDSLIKGLPDDWRLHAARGLALAGLGRRNDALREAQWLRASVRYQKDAGDWAMLAEERARILAQAGEPDAALEEVEHLLARPSLLTVHTLRLDPRWDQLRSHPGFQSLLVRYADVSRN